MSSRLGGGRAPIRLYSGFRLVRLATLMAFAVGFGVVAQAENSTVRVLHSFFSEADSKQPISLTKAKNGLFYGTTIGGEVDLGTVFSISEDGSFTTLYFFRDGRTGDFPYGQLVEGNDGNFYGTTIYGGAKYQGVAFRITPEGVFTILHDFGSDPTDGTHPWGGVVRGRDGNFYGSTFDGGLHGVGTVYRMTPEGKVTILHNFAATGDTQCANLDESHRAKDAPERRISEWSRDGVGKNQGTGVQPSLKRASP